MKPSQRRRSALFRAYLAANPSAAKSSGETDSEDMCGTWESGRALLPTVIAAIAAVAIVKQEAKAHF